MTEKDQVEDPRFRELFEQFYRRAYSLFMRHGFSSDEAQDLTQEVFLRIHKSMPTYRGEGKWSFVREIAENVRKNVIRHDNALRRRATKLPIDDPDTLSPSVGGDSAVRLSPPTPEDIRSAREGVERLRFAIENLPDRNRWAIQLQVYGDLSYLEIGAVLGTTREAVKALLRRTRQMLKRELSRPDE